VTVDYSATPYLNFRGLLLREGRGEEGREGKGRGGEGTGMEGK